MCLCRPVIKFFNYSAAGVYILPVKTRLAHGFVKNFSQSLFNPAGINNLRTAPLDFGTGFQQNNGQHKRNFRHCFAAAQSFGNLFSVHFFAVFVAEHFGIGRHFSRTGRYHMIKQMRIFTVRFGRMNFFHFSFKNCSGLRIVKNPCSKRLRIIKNIGHKSKYRLFCFNTDLNYRTVLQQIVGLHGMDGRQLQRGQFIFRRSFSLIVGHLFIQQFHYFFQHTDIILKLLLNLSGKLGQNIFVQFGKSLDGVYA